jgi:glycosyltransferase involved in cell wall biosynthesis
MISRVVVLCKSWLEMTCGALNTMRALRHLNKEVLCICSACRAETKAELESLGISVEQIHVENPFPRDLFGKIQHCTRFRRRAWHIVDKQGPEALMWVIRIDTAMALGRRLLKRPYILTLQELHDKYPVYQRAIRLYGSNARALVVPEFCRASILRYWHKLASTPFVLPNKPELRFRERRLPISDPTAAQIIESIPNGRKIILYQGVLARDRDIEPVARAIRELGKEYCLVVMGQDRDGVLGRLRQACQDLIHIPWVRPPAHLEVTSHAHIGIAFYKFDALNSIFCAPNKIWEYSGFGIPMICQDLPGLRYTVGIADAGVCIDSECAEAIAGGVKRIEADYRYYSERARIFYESVSTTDTVSQIVGSTLADKAC